MALATNHGPSADDFYTGGGKRRGMDNIDTRNFLADTFLGRTHQSHQRLNSCKYHHQFLNHNKNIILMQPIIPKTQVEGNMLGGTGVNLVHVVKNATIIH